LQPIAAQNLNEPTIQCQMCNCATFESYLKKHIQYNHMIHRHNIVDILYKLHYPTELCCVQTQTANTWVSDLSLAHIDAAGCFREELQAREEEPPVPLKPAVLCSVCGNKESEMMIACEKCHGWYHWKCVGITQNPLPNDVWFCSHCINTETEDNLPAEESQPSQEDAGSSQEIVQSADTGQNTIVEGQKFSESQILIRETGTQGRRRSTRSTRSDQNVVTDEAPEQASTSSSVAQPILITEIPDNREEVEDPFTEVVRRKRKKRGTRIEQENKPVIAEPTVSAEINIEDTKNDTIDSFNIFQGFSNEDFDIGNPQDDTIEDELVDIQEEKAHVSVRRTEGPEKSKQKLMNTFSVKVRNSKSTRLGKRKEKKIGVLKLQEIIPSARKPLKILIGGKQTIEPEEEISKVGEDKGKRRAVIVREIKQPVVKQPNKSDETWKGKGIGKGKRGRGKLITTSLDQLETKTSENDAIFLDKSQQKKELNTRGELSCRKNIEENTNEVHSSKPQNKVKIKRLSTTTKKQNKSMQSETYKDNEDKNLMKPANSIKETKEKQILSKTSLDDLTPFIYRIHKGKKQMMRVTLNKRNNKMRLSQETIDFARKYYLQKPEDQDQCYIYMNNQYMQLKCFKFITDEQIPAMQNLKRGTKKDKSESLQKNESKNVEEILSMKKAQVSKNQKSSSTSRKFSKEAVSACMLENKDTTPGSINIIKTKEVRDNRELKSSGKVNGEVENSQKEHKIKSSIKKRTRKPILTGRAKVALSFDTNTFENKEGKKPKEHSPQRNRLNNILDTLRTKNIEKIHQLHDSDSAADQPGPSRPTRQRFTIRYPSGSVVWAKMEESPWWPGLVDFCPDSEEYYWMEEGGLEPSWYHIVFFDKGEHVTRSWVREELIQVFEENKTFDHPSLQDMDRSRLNDSLAMAKNCLEKTRDQRLAKFSLATLFQGSWGKSPHPNKSPFHPFIGDTWESSFIDPSDQFSPIKLPKIPDDEENPNIDAVSEPSSPDPPPSDVDQGPVFHCLMCDENVERTKSTILHHLTRHKVTLDDYPRIFVSHREDQDMKLIMKWIKEDEEQRASNGSEPVSEGPSHVTRDSDKLEEGSQLQDRHAFLKSQREMFVKAKFKCKLSDSRVTNNEEQEIHMETHAKGSNPQEDLNNAETFKYGSQKKPASVEQTQPIKDWICTKPQYFTGYSVVIKKKERRVANLELALSNAPAPPPPQEREPQEPVLPTSRPVTITAPAHLDHQTKNHSSKKQNLASTSAGLSDQLPGELQVQETRKNNPQTSQQTFSQQKKDNPKVSHSVEALIHNPREERKSLDLRRYESLNHTNKETKTGDENYEHNVKIRSPEKEAIDLSMK